MAFAPPFTRLLTVFLACSALPSEIVDMLNLTRLPSTIDELTCDVFDFPFLDSGDRFDLFVMYCAFVVVLEVDRLTLVFLSRLSSPIFMSLSVLYLSVFTGFS